VLRCAPRAEFQGGSKAGGAADKSNNEKSVFLTGPGAHSRRIRSIFLGGDDGVLPNATQLFALVVSPPQCTLDIDSDGNNALI